VLEVERIKKGGDKKRIKKDKDKKIKKGHPHFRTKIKKGHPHFRTIKRA
tara:strand:- start:241 stop:387 length:147 start_codon:yes stop_codon:yes gene_type:complete